MNLIRNHSFEDDGREVNAPAGWDVFTFYVSGKVKYVGEKRLHTARTNDPESRFAGLPLLPSESADGKYGLVFAEPEATDGLWRVMAIQNVCAVRPGDVYEISAWAKTTKTLLQGVMFIMPDLPDFWWQPGVVPFISVPEEGFDGAPHTGKYGRTCLAPVCDESWREYRYTLTVPEEWGTGSMLQIKFEGRGWADEAMIVDNVRVAKK